MFLSRSMDGFRRIHKTAKSNCLSFRTEQLGSQGMSFMKFYILVVSKNLFRKNVSLKSKKIAGAVHGAVTIFVKIFHPIILKMRLFPKKKTDREN